jgi:glycosyltransferase involved in cell wall biosynthesis
MMNSTVIEFPPIDTEKEPIPFKVLFILGTLWGENGVTSHLKTLSSGLIENNIQIAVASDIASMNIDAHDQAMIAVEDFKGKGIRYYTVPFSLNSGIDKLRNLLDIIKDLDYIIQDFKPDIIHLHSLSVVPYVHLLKLKYKIPFVSTCHQKPSPSPSKSFIIRLIHKVMPNLLGDHFIAISSEVQQIFGESLRIPTKSISCIYHGVDSSYFRPPSLDEKAIARKAFGLESDENVVCLIGRLDPKKGHHILIQAMSILKKENLKLSVLFAGKDYLDEAQQIKACASSHNLLGKIKFLGMTDAQAVLWASDILVLPSQTEAFGLVIPEAMLSGVVSIRTPSGGASDQIQQGVNGFLVPFEDPDSLAEKIRFLILNEHKRIEMAENALNIAKAKFTVEIMVRETINVYRRLIPSLLR